MKILMLTPYLPFPLHSGGQIRTYNLLKNLSAKHQITLFSFIRSDSEKRHIKELEKFCLKVIPYKRRKAWSPINILLSGLTYYPFLVCLYHPSGMKKLIKEELERGYDLIHAETFYVMPNLPKTSLPILLVEQTIEYLVYQNFVDNFKVSLLKPFLYFDVKKIKLWEKYYWKRATRLATMSREDKELIKNSLKNGQVDIVANGVDIDFFGEAEKKKPKTPTVLFVGNFKWLPNKDAASLLAREIWPKVLEKIPKARLLIVGRNPTQKIRDLGSIPGVAVKDEVKDIREAFGCASVLLAPIRNGRGTKYKVLEAMATGVPVVTTPLGIEGIEAKDGREVLVAKTAEGLAKETINLLQDKDLGEKLALSAKKLINTKYNWQLISESLDKIYQEMGKKHV